MFCAIVLFVNVLPKKAGNEFQGVSHVPTNFWTRGDTTSIATTVFVINTNFMVTLLPGNK